MESLSLTPHTGRVAIVTGASRGIGRAVAMELALGGAKVVVNYRQNAAAAQEVVEHIRAGGGEAIAVEGDVSQHGAAEALVEAAIKSFGRLDILVNNAGIARDALVMRMSEADWEAVLATNLKGAFLCTRAALRPMLRARWGRIINVASVVGIMGNAGQANYAAAKAGLIGLTRAVAREVGSRGITVNAVAPGFIETEMTAALPDGLRQEVMKQIVLGRFGQPSDVAAVVSFLASERASYITGQVLNVDGGMVMA